jgi:hypothetical protein
MAPVHHGHFSFDNGTFYVTTPDGHTHPRADYWQLYAIFGSDIGVQHPDPDHPGHWYEAQVIHYGLTPTSNAAPAKLILQDAFQNRALEVPRGVFQIEEKLRKEWTRKALQEAAGPAPEGQSSGFATLDGASNDGNSQSGRKDMIPTSRTTSAEEPPPSTQNVSAAPRMVYDRVSISSAMSNLPIWIADQNDRLHQGLSIHSHQSTQTMHVEFGMTT